MSLDDKIDQSLQLKVPIAPAVNAAAMAASFSTLKNSERILACAGMPMDALSSLIFSFIVDSLRETTIDAILCIGFQGGSLALWLL
jgi:hypothetical protein